MTSAIRIVLADDHPIVLEGLRNLLRAESGFELVGEATSGRSAWNIICETVPDVAVIDISMLELNGIVLTRRLSAECPSVRVLLLTFHEDRAYINLAFAAGARGYALKRTAAENLVHAIRAVHVGGLYIDSAVVDLIGPGNSRMGRPAPLNPTACAELPTREAEVLRLAAMGFTNKEIAHRLSVGVKSVETYKARAAEKLGLKSRAELVRFAAAQGWLSDL